MTPEDLFGQPIYLPTSRSGTTGACRRPCRDGDQDFRGPATLPRMVWQPQVQESFQGQPGPPCCGRSTTAGWSGTSTSRSTGSTRSRWTTTPSREAGLRAARPADRRAAPLPGGEADRLPARLEGLLLAPQAGQPGQRRAPAAGRGAPVGVQDHRGRRRALRRALPVRPHRRGHKLRLQTVRETIALAPSPSTPPR